jgi:succinate dehydrogenase flavin-adding protein (antitoxin of CptAB toxin-antitoxin module)
VVEAESEIQQFVSVVLLPLEVAQKEHFTKLLDQILDREIYTILEHANVLYQTVLFRASMEELVRLEKLLELAKVSLDKNLFTQYLNTSNDQNSMYCYISCSLKQLGLELDQEGSIHRAIAVQIAENISP